MTSFKYPQGTHINRAGHTGTLITPSAFWVVLVGPAVAKRICFCLEKRTRLSSSWNNNSTFDTEGEIPAPTSCIA